MLWISVSVKISLFLADFAQTDDKAKVNAIGLGWTRIAAPLPPFALVLILDVEWDELNRRHAIRCELLTEDGQVVSVPGPAGPEPIVLEAFADAGRPPELACGTPMRVPICVTIPGGMPFPPGRYEWRASVGGFEDAVAVQSFVVLACVA